MLSRIAVADWTPERGKVSPVEVMICEFGGEEERAEGGIMAIGQQSSL